MELPIIYVGPAEVRLSQEITEITLKKRNLNNFWEISFIKGEQKSLCLVLDGDKFIIELNPIIQARVKTDYPYLDYKNSADSWRYIIIQSLPGREHDISARISFA